MNNNEKWIGMYYPNHILEKRRSRAIACLLFDKIICYFPIADMICGGGQGLSHTYDDDPLVSAGIMEVREKFLLPEVKTNFSSGHFWGTNKEFDFYQKSQITCMTFKGCRRDNQVPITDDVTWSIPSTLKLNIDLKRFARFQATALAFHSLDVLLPPIAGVNDEVILEAREKLKEQLIPFRRAMLTLSPTVRAGIDSDASVEDIYRESKYIVETNIAPAVNELNDRLQREKGKFWKRIIIKTAQVLPKFIMDWTTKDMLTAALDSVENTKDIISEGVTYRELLESLKQQGGLGYLLSVANYSGFQPKKIKE